ncbi:hypothetical protein CRYUN_Cryun31cG0096900 [Craigia yunnanensis]
MYTIEGRRNIAGGRLMTDRRSAANSSLGKCFTTLCYSADGSYILAGGSSRYICMYDVADQSKNMTESGPLDLIDDDNSDTEEGRSFSAATTEGVLVYSIDESFIFDPMDLDIDVTPEAIDKALNEDQPSRALILSLRLNGDTLIKKCIFCQSSRCSSSCFINPLQQRLIDALADLQERCPHLRVRASLVSGTLQSSW